MASPVVVLADAFGLFQGKPTIAVTLRFYHFRARWVRGQHWHPHQQIREQSDGGLELTLPVADFREIKTKIMQFGADVEVLAPPELRRQIRTEIGAMQALYGREGS